jgi:imidazolonepropionase-like amidohydrolase
MELRYYLAACLCTAAMLCAQSPREARRVFLAPGATTTDDPRRIPVPNTPKGPPGVLVLKGGRIFDSVKPEAYPGTLVIERNHIQAILPPASADWPKDATVIDVAGETVMPGMIDLHTHIGSPAADTPVDEQTDEAAITLVAANALMKYVEAGITSIRDMGSLEMVPFVLKEWAAADRMVSPRLFVAGKIITGLGGHGAERPLIAIHTPPYRKEVAGPYEWRNAVRETFKRGADLVKISSHFSPDEVKAAVEEAHNLGLKVACDCETFYAQWAVEAGVDTIEHPLPKSDDTLQLMARRQVASDPTLVVYENLINTRGGYYNSTSRRFTMTKEGDFKQFLRMKELGIKMGIGTDTAAMAIDRMHANYLRELQLFVEGGYTVPEALIAATKTNAEILDMADKLGTLEPGKLADVIVVTGEPDKRLEDLRKVDKVIRDGFIVADHGHITIPRYLVDPPQRQAGAGQ